MHRSRELVALSALLVVPLAVALVVHLQGRAGEPVVESSMVAEAPVAAPAPEPAPVVAAPVTEPEAAPMEAAPMEVAPAPGPSLLRDPSAIMLVHQDALVLNTSPEITWSSGKIEVRARSGELIASRRADVERLPEPLRALAGATVMVFAADGSACVAEASAPRLTMERTGEVYMGILEEGEGAGDGEVDTYEPPRDKARVRAFAEREFLAGDGGLLLAKQRSQGGTACKGVWARRADLPAPAVFGRRELDEAEAAALVGDALGSVRAMPEFAAAAAAYAKRAEEYGEDSGMPSWEEFVAANFRATRWDEVGGPRRFVSAELHEIPEGCGDFFGESVAVLFEVQEGALFRLSQPGWLGLVALMDVDRDGILEGIRRDDLTTSIVAAGPGAESFVDAFTIDYFGCRC